MNIKNLISAFYCCKDCKNKECHVLEKINLMKQNINYKIDDYLMECDPCRGHTKILILRFKDDYLNKNINQCSDMKIDQCYIMKIVQCSIMKIDDAQITYCNWSEEYCKMEYSNIRNVMYGILSNQVDVTNKFKALLSKNSDYKQLGDNTLDGKLDPAPGKGKVFFIQSDDSCYTANQDTKFERISKGWWDGNNKYLSW